MHVSGAIDASRQTLKFLFCQNQSNLIKISQFSNGIQLYFKDSDKEPVEIRIERRRVVEVVKALERSREVLNRKRTRKKSVLKRSLLSAPRQKEERGLDFHSHLF